MKHLTQEAWNKLAVKVTNYVTQGKGSRAILAVLESWFPRAQPSGNAQKKVSPEALAGLLFEMATERRGSMENITVTLAPEPEDYVLTPTAKPFSQRSVWRYWLFEEDYDLQQLQRDMLQVCHMFFVIARRRFGLFTKRFGFDVLIDGHETMMYVKRPIREDGSPHPKARALSMVSSASKEGEYVLFRSLTYECMVAVCRKTGIAIPLAAVLVCPKGRDFPPGLAVPDKGGENVIRMFINLLETVYKDERPWLLAFDRGYHANVNYARAIAYCNKRGCVLMTPAKKESGAFVDDKDTSHSNVTAFMEHARTIAKRVPGTDVFYAVTPKRLRTDGSIDRYLIVFFRPRDDEKKDRADPDDLVLPDGTRVFGFYTNHPNAEKRIEVFERLYSRRWEIEHWYSTRKGNFNGGRQHDPMKRMCTFMVGVVALSVYALMRGIRYPRWDPDAVSRHYNVPMFVRQVREAVVRRRLLGSK